MSYARMDHAEWVTRNNRALNRIYGKRKSFRALPETLSKFQSSVCDIVGMVFGGIYNAPIDWSKVDWISDYGVSIPLRHCGAGMSTWDFNALTIFVFLCHEARIRGDISGYGRASFRLNFHKRKHTGDISSGHPNLDEAVASFRDYLPLDHRIINVSEEVSS